MSAAPEIETRTEQPYVAIRAQVTMDGIAALRRPHRRGVRLAGRPRPDARRGPPFLKYNVIDMARELEMENGRPGRGGRGRR